MSKKFQVEANGTVFGVYAADDAQAARDACAADAGYESEADMAVRLGRPSELVATELNTAQLILSAGGDSSAIAQRAEAAAESVDQDWEHEATLFAFADGSVLVASGPHCNAHADMAAAHASL